MIREDSTNMALVSKYVCVLVICIHFIDIFSIIFPVDNFLLLFQFKTVPNHDYKSWDTFFCINYVVLKKLPIVFFPIRYMTR